MHGGYVVISCIHIMLCIDHVIMCPADCQLITVNHIILIMLMLGVPHQPIILLGQSCTDITVKWCPSSNGGDPSSKHVTIWLKKTVVGATSVVAMGTMTYSSSSVHKLGPG